MAFEAQRPGQGSLHFWLMHAKWLEHSLLLIHSGLQFGGEPRKSGKQEHDGLSPDTLHWALGPQGDGIQGLVGGAWGSSANGKKSNNFGYSLKMEIVTRKFIIQIFQDRRQKEILTLDIASYKWVASVSRWAFAQWIMVYDITNGSNATWPRARIPAFLIATSFISITIRVHCTLRTTGWWRTSVSSQTWTDRLPIDCSALTVRTTWRRLTRCCNNWGSWNWYSSINIF